MKVYVGGNDWSDDLIEEQSIVLEEMSDALASGYRVSELTLYFVDKTGEKELFLQDAQTIELRDDSDNVLFSGYTLPTRFYRENEAEIRVTCRTWKEGKFEKALSEIGRDYYAANVALFLSKLYPNTSKEPVGLEIDSTKLVQSVMDTGPALEGLSPYARAQDIRDIILLRDDGSYIYFVTLGNRNNSGYFVHTWRIKKDTYEIEYVHGRQILSDGIWLDYAKLAGVYVDGARVVIAGANYAEKKVKSVVYDSVNNTCTENTYIEFTDLGEEDYVNIVDTAGSAGLDVIVMQYDSVYNSGSGLYSVTMRVYRSDSSGGVLLGTTGFTTSHVVGYTGGFAYEDGSEIHYMAGTYGLTVYYHYDGSNWAAKSFVDDSLYPDGIVGVAKDISDGVFFIVSTQGGKKIYSTKYDEWTSLNVTEECIWIKQNRSVNDFRGSISLTTTDRGKYFEIGVGGILQEKSILPTIYYGGKNYVYKELVFIDEDGKYHGIVVHHNFRSNKGYVASTTYSTGTIYPHVVIDNTNKDKDISDVIREIEQYGLYNVHKVDDDTLVIENTLGTGNTYSLSQNEFRILKDVSTSQRVSVVNLRSVLGGEENTLRNGTGGKELRAESYFFTIHTLNIIGSRILHYYGKQSAIYRLKMLNNSIKTGDKIVFNDQLNREITGKVIGVRRELPYVSIYYVLADVDTTGTPQVPDTPEVSVPYIEDISVETTHIIMGSYKIVAIKIKGNNVGAKITQIVLRRAKWVRNEDGIWGYTNEESNYTANIIGTFEWSVTFIEKAETAFSWTAQFYSDGGMASQVARGSEGVVFPRLQEVYAKSGKVVASGIGFMTGTLNANPAMCDNDDDGIPDGWDVDDDVQIILRTDNRSGKYAVEIYLDNTAGTTEKSAGIWSEFIPYPDFGFPVLIEVVRNFSLQHGAFGLWLMAYDAGKNELSGNPVISPYGGPYDTESTLTYNDGVNLWMMERAGIKQLPVGTRFIRLYLVVTASAGDYARMIVDWAGIRYGIQGPEILPTADIDLFGKKIRNLASPADAQDAATKEYVDNRDPYAHEQTSLPTCNASNYGRMIIYDYVDATTHHNQLLVCKKTGANTYDWVVIKEDTWTEGGAQ